MKQFTGFIILFFLTVVSTCWSQVNEDLVLTDKDTFGKFRCGMSKEEIENTLNAKLKYNEKTVHYYTPYYLHYNIPSIASFSFNQNKLTSLYFFVLSKNKNALDLVTEYFRIKKIIENEYGAYYYNGTSWKIKMDNPTLEEYANALENDNVHLYFMWRTTKMEINYRLYKDSNYPLEPYYMYTTVLCSLD